MSRKAMQSIGLILLLAGALLALTVVGAQAMLGQVTSTVVADEAAPVAVVPQSERSADPVQPAALASEPGLAVSPASSDVTAGVDVRSPEVEAGRGVDAVNALLPSNSAGKLTNPLWNISLDAAGYADIMVYNHHGLNHEMLSGDWASALRYDELGTANIQQGPNAGSPQSMWLSNRFVCPDFTTNSTFEVVSPFSSWDDPLNPVFGLDTGYSIISNGDVTIRIDFKMIDTRVDMGRAPQMPNPIVSERYILSQRYTITNTGTAALNNLELFQFLHAHPGDRYDGGVKMVYDPTYYPPRPETTHEAYKYDMTAWAVDNHLGMWEFVGFASSVAPGETDNANPAGVFGFDSFVGCNTGRPSVGLHVSVEDDALAGPGPNTIVSGEIAGAQKYGLASLLQVGESVSHEVILSIGGHSDFFWKSWGWEDYAPYGVPDFDMKRQLNGWYNFDLGKYVAAGPVAVANSFWWFDSKFEPNPKPPTEINDNYPLVTAIPNAMDDHNPGNVAPYIESLMGPLGMTALGTDIQDLYDGVVAYLLQKELSYTVYLIEQPGYGDLAEWLSASSDVILLLGFYQQTTPNRENLPWSRLGGHFVTLNGYGKVGDLDSISISDPFFDRAVNGWYGRVMMPAHAGQTGYGPGVHDDASYLSHDVYPVGPAQTIHAQMGIPGFVNTASEVSPFVGLNHSMLLDTGTLNEPVAGPIATEVEYMLVVVPNLPDVELVVDKTASQTEVEPGSEMYFTIYYENTSTQTAYDVQISDILPAGVYANPAITFQPDFDYPVADITEDGTEANWRLRTIPPGGTGYVVLPVIISPNAVPSTTLVNTVGIFSSQLENDYTNNNATASVHVAQPPSGGLGNFVWHDWDGDGLQGPNEPGLPGVPLELWFDDGFSPTMIATTTTNAAGYYTFTLPDPGTYIVKVFPPSDFVPTIQDAGPDHLDSDVDLDNKMFLLGYSGSGFIDNLDAGYFQYASLGGFKWEDLNADGQPAGNEPGIISWTIYLEPHAAPLLDLRGGPGTRSEQTGPTGHYTFTEVPPGTYTITEESRSGWLQSWPIHAPGYVITVHSGQVVTDAIFGNYVGGSIHGVKFEDHNADGRWQYWWCQTWEYDGIIPFPLTYCPYQTAPDQPLVILDGLPGGSSIEIPASFDYYKNVYETSGGIFSGTIITFEAMLTLELSGTGGLAGYSRPIYLPIQVEMHTGPHSGSPVQDFPSDLMRLQGQVGGDPDFDLLRITAGTDFGLPSPGHTTLTQLPEGDWQVDSFFDITYRIDFVGASGGPFDGLSGSTYATATMKTPHPSMGGEMGMGGVQFVLNGTTAQGSFSATTVTDWDGEFHFEALPPGSYYLQEVVPPWAFPTTTPSTQILVESGQEWVAYPGQAWLWEGDPRHEVFDPVRMTFGNFVPGQIYGRKFHDLDGSGTLDWNDPPLNGWPITLTNSAQQLVLTTTTRPMLGWNWWYEYDYMQRITLHFPWEWQLDWQENEPGINRTGGPKSASFGGGSGGAISFGHPYSSLGHTFSLLDVYGRPAAVPEGETYVLPIELVAMELYGTDPISLEPLTLTVRGISSTVPSTPSTGIITVTNVGGSLQIDSFFDIFFEVQRGGNGFANPGPLHLEWHIPPSANFPPDGLLWLPARFLESSLSISLVDLVNQDGFGMLTLAKARPLVFEEGWYSFTNLLPGEYVVTEGMLPGWDHSTSISYTIQITHSRQVVKPVDFGNFIPGSIHPFKFEDVNADGWYSPTNPYTGDPLDIPFAEAVLFELVGDVDGDGDLDTLQNETNNLGFVDFAGLHPGWYTVTEIVLSGTIPTTPLTRTIYVESGQEWVGVPEQTNYNDELHEYIVAPWQGLAFGNTVPGSIHGLKFHDIDGDGIYSPTVDTLWPGVEFVLHGDVDGDGAWDTLTHTTDVDGEFDFTGLYPGEYTLKEVVPPGSQISSFITEFNFFLSSRQEWVAYPGQAGLGPEALQVEVELPSLKVGNVIPGSIHGFKFEDVDADGIYSPTVDQPMESIEFQLTGDYNGDGEGETFSWWSDENGEFEFVNLWPGEYTLEEMVPPGMTATTPYTLSFMVPSGIEFVAFPGQSGIPAYEGDLRDEVLLGAELMFGNARASGLTGYKWHDLDADGVWDWDEPGLENWVIGLYPASSPASALTTTTNASGFYQFGELQPGTYVVFEGLPNLWSQSYPGTLTHTVTITSGQLLEEVNFGNFYPSSIHGFKWHDLDADGWFDLEEAEPPLPGVSFTLAGDNGLVLTTTSGQDGRFDFPNLPPGVYTLTEDVPLGWVPTTPVTRVFTVTSAVEYVAFYEQSGVPAYTGDPRTEVKLYELRFGNVIPGSIHGFKFEDRNVNGIYDPEVDAPLAGVTFNLHIPDVMVISSTTGADGQFHFDGLLPGWYYLVEDLPEGWFGTTMTKTWILVQTGIEYTAFPGQSGVPAFDGDPRYELVVGDELKFGNAYPGSLHGFKYFDVDQDGIYSPTLGDYPLQDVEFILYSQWGTFTTTTGADGALHFEGLHPGLYFLAEMVPDGWVATTSSEVELFVPSRTELVAFPGQAGLPAFEGDPRFEQVVGAELIFGNYRYSTLSGYKWADLDGDGVWDDGEPPIQDWEIRLYGGEGFDVLVDVAQTDENGFYQFHTLLPGTYALVEELPAGWACSYPIACPALVVEVPESMDLTGFNFGNYITGSIHGFKFEDEDGDGAWNPEAEPPVQGIVFKLTGGSEVMTATTNAMGFFDFAGLRPGVYTVTELLASPWQPSTPISRVITVTFGIELVALAEQINHNDSIHEYVVVGERLMWGNYIPGSFHGFKFEDMFADGVYEPEEGDRPLAGAEFDVYALGPGPMPSSALLDSETITPFIRLVSDSSGNFSVEGLAPGWYGIVEVSGGPGGEWYPSTEDTWLIGIFSRQEIATYEGQVVLPPGDPRVVIVAVEDYFIAFGNYRMATFDGYKWYDTNGNGIWDSDEPPIAGWVVTATKDSAGPVFTTTTDANGYYKFDLGPGDYLLQEALPDGWEQTYYNVSYGGLLDGVGAVTYIISSGQTMRFDWGNRELGEVTGFKWHDLNANGVWDTTEPPLSNVVIQMIRDDNEYVYNTLTDNGVYTFTNVVPGVYLLREIIPSPWQQSYPYILDGEETYVITVTAGASLDGYNFGNFIPGSIHGFKFEDMNGDGVYDAGDLPLEGVEFRVQRLGSNGLRLELPGIEISTLTGPDGEFDFPELIPGVYELAEVLPEGWLSTTPPITRTVVVTSNIEVVAIPGQSLIPGHTDHEEIVVPELLTFGNFKGGVIHGHKFGDRNGNGEWEPAQGEPGLSDWEIHLYKDGSLYLTTTTGANGAYSFNGLPLGVYTVTEVQQPGWQQTTPNPTQVYVTSSGQLFAQGLDFGNKPEDTSGVIVGFKFHDLNGDGEHQPLAGETGLEGFLIVAVNTATSHTYSAWTDENGAFAFIGLPPGEYLVKEIVPAGWALTTPTAPYVVDLAAGETESGLLFGNYKLGQLYGQKFEDLNGNGMRNAGEPGLNGWVIRLYTQAGQFITETETLDNDSDDDGLIDLETEAGWYSFHDLPQGSYFIVEVQQPGWVKTHPTTTGRSVVIGPSGTIISQGLDFGNFKLGELHGRKYEDLNGSGEWDPGEPGLNDWTIVLRNGQGQVLTTTTTMDMDLNGDNQIDPSTESGWYWFQNLPEGFYVLAEEQVAGWLQTEPANLTYSLAITRSGTIVDEGLDFGNFKLGAVHGQKFEDLNGNGQRDPGEPGMNGWVIRLVNESGVITETITMDMDMNDDGVIDPETEKGWYWFEGLYLGQYFVYELEKQGWMQTYPVTPSINSTAGHVLVIDHSGQVIVEGTDFGNFQRAELHGQKYLDINANGQRDANEPGLNNWTIILRDENGQEAARTTTMSMDLNQDQVINPVTEMGWYWFQGLPPGTYTLEEVLKPEWHQSAPAGGQHTVVVDESGMIVSQGLDFGNYVNGSIHLFKFLDGNGDGQYQPFNPINNLAGQDYPQPGVVFKLTGDVDGDGDLDTIEVASDAQGRVDFPDLHPGLYTIEEMIPAGMVSTTPANQPTLELVVHSGIEYVPFENWLDLPQTSPKHQVVISRLRYGNLWLGEISGYKFSDTNGNGRWDAGEPPLQGWVIFLDLNNNFLRDAGEPAALTGADGKYHFTGLKPGLYLVREVLQTGYKQTLPGSPDFGYPVYVFSSLEGGTIRTGLNFGNFPFNDQTQSPEISAYRPERMRSDTPVTMTVLGANFVPGQTGAFLRPVALDGRVASLIPLDTTVESPQLLKAEVEAGLEPGFYDLVVATAAGGSATWPAAFEVVAPAAPEVHEVTPPAGENDTPVIIDIYGAYFSDQVSVTLHLSGSQDITDTVVLVEPLVISSTLIRAVVPISIPVGLYDVTVTHVDPTPARDTVPLSGTLQGGYRALVPGTINDLVALHLRVLPHHPFEGDPDVRWRLTGFRKGGLSPLLNVPVEVVVYQFGAEERETVSYTLTAVIPQILPNSAFTVTVDWVPPNRGIVPAGTYLAVAQIDPVDGVVEVSSLNNRARHFVVVHPPRRDRIPPVVTDLLINEDAEETTSRDVVLSVNASDPDTLRSASGVVRAYFLEFIFDQNYGRWKLVQKSGWLDWTPTPLREWATFPWNLTPDAGIHYIQVWVADKAGNISEKPAEAFINLGIKALGDGSVLRTPVYLPTLPYLLAGQVHLFRLDLEQGEQVTLEVTSYGGNALVYVWAPDDGLVDNDESYNAVKTISFTAPEAGIYQVEIEGEINTYYQIAVGEGLAEASRAVDGEGRRGRLLPLTNSGDMPAAEVGVESAPSEESSFIIFLPILNR